MKQHKAIMIQNSLEKSDEAYNNAEHDLNNNMLYGAQNRIYYAIFYAVTALGYCEEFTTTKHSELLGWFNGTMVYEKAIFSKNLQKTYKIAQENRKKSDYTFTYKPNREDLTKLLEDAKEFISEIKKYIETKGL